MTLTTLKPQAVVTGKDLEKYMPHRFENVLVDKVEAFADNPDKLLCILELTLQEKDALGRELFLVKGQHGGMIYNGYMFPEAMALGALTYLNTILGAGHIALFSTISNVVQTSEIKAGETMKGMIYLKRGKGAFNTFSGKVLNAKNEVVAENDIMAFVVKAAEAPAAGSGEKKKVEPPVKTMDMPLSAEMLPTKDARMFFADHLYAYNDTDHSAIVSFEYKKDHPFTKGHFPGNPIMMGICQWMAAGDAVDMVALQLLKKGGLKDGMTITADVDLLKEDGTLITEIAQIARHYKVSGTTVIPRLVSTKKCGFRDMVTPSTRVFQRVGNVQIS